MNSIQAFFSANAAPLLWLLAALVLLIIEAATVQMVCIWFCVGAVFAVVAALLGATAAVQIIVFVAVSALALLLTRRFVKNVLNFKKVPTNADSVVGQEGVVLEEINNIEEAGRVRAAGLDWSARSDNGKVIREGTRVKVLALSGVKLIVEPVSAKEE